MKPITRVVKAIHLPYFPGGYSATLVPDMEGCISSSCYAYHPDWMEHFRDGTWVPAEGAELIDHTPEDLSNPIITPLAEAIARELAR